MNILCIGDIVGKPGRNFINTMLPKLISEYSIDFVVANGENCAHGVGLTRNTYEELVYAGVDVITMGNHTWAKKEVIEFIEEKTNLIRPANFPSNNPGRGYTIVEKAGKRIAVINLIGRVYLDSYDCPFSKVDDILEKLQNQADIIIIDFHAEATSEKLAMGWYLDGKVTAVFGTHTHVQTSDERLLPQGTAYITDVGMTGPYDSILGVDKDIIIKKFITLMPGKFEVADGKAVFGALLMELEGNTVKSVKRLSIIEE
jgi:2',3'-cyclic-nucleotide 2'-phosphodiesterase